MSEKTTVEVPIVWIEGLLRKQEGVWLSNMDKEVSKVNCLDNLLGYIESARSFQ